MTNESNESNKGGYKNLIVYRQAVMIFDLTDEFCKKYLDRIRDKRTIEQMTQAARSGKQNIVEGSLEKSLKMNIKLTGVARASLGELLEDYEDFLRTRKLDIWHKNDSRVMEIRNAYRKNKSNKTNKSNMSNESDLTYSIYLPYITDPTLFANLMLTLISTENYLLDKMIRSLEAKFICEGGYSENLAKKRREFRGY